MPGSGKGATRKGLQAKQEAIQKKKDDAKKVRACGRGSRKEDCQAAFVRGWPSWTRAWGCVVVGLGVIRDRGRERRVDEAV